MSLNQYILDVMSAKNPIEEEQASIRFRAREEAKHAKDMEHVHEAIDKLGGDKNCHQQADKFFANK